MKELHVSEKKRPNPDSEKNAVLKSKRNKAKKILTRVKAKVPTCSSCEIPILSILSRAPEGMPTKVVLNSVLEWFDRLEEDDRNARYLASRKKIVETIIKYARKNLVIKNEIFPPGEKNPIGTWRATGRGLERAVKEREGWRPRYTIRDAVLITEEEVFDVGERRYRAVHARSAPSLGAGP